MINEDGILMLIIQDVTKHFDGKIGLQVRRQLLQSNIVNLLQMTNRLGDASCNANLTVHAKDTPPRFTKEISAQTVDEKATATFEATVVGTPTPEIQWYHKGKLLDDSAKFKMFYTDGACRLTIADVSADDIG